MSSIKSKILSLSDYYHFFVVGIVLVALSLKYIFFIFVLILFLLVLLLKNKKIFICSIVVILLFGLHYCLKELVYNQSLNISNYNFKIIDKKIGNTYINYVIKNGLHKYQFSSKEKYEIGDIIRIDGVIEKQVIHYPNAFDYQEYLHYQNIKGIIKPDKITTIDNQFCLSKLNYYIQDLIINNMSGIGKDYLMTLTIGVDDTLDTDNISKIGISHLFVISGLHVAMIIMFLEFIMKKLKVKPLYQKIIIVIILGGYVLIVNFLISVIRVYLNYLLKLMFKLKQLDLISINFMIVVLINPYIIFQLSFILSYLIAFFMCIYQEKQILKNKFLNKTLNLYILTFLIQLLVFPFVVSINPDFNIISILVNPLFIFIVSYIFLPFSFLTLIIPIIYPLYSLFASIFDYLVENIAKIDVLTICLGNTNVYLKSLYYVCFYFLLKGYYLNILRYYMVFIIIVVCWYFKGVFVLNDQVYFLDLPEGDASLIISKNSTQVILIDTGEVTNNNIMTKILKDFGIKKINYLIITHGDSDHIGGAYDICRSIKIENLILNKYDVLEKSYPLRKKAKNILLLESGNMIKEQDFYLKVLSPSKNYQNINDNSLTFILNFKNLRILYTGDISEKVELEIINDYKGIDVDILKIAHHGSTTSSSIKFLESIKYRYAVIMSGYYNTFGFPKDEVVNRIPNKKRLLTKDLTTICFTKQKNRWVLKN